MAGLAASGAGAGLASGVEVGSLGLAGGPAIGAVTVTRGAVINGVGGAASAVALGMSICPGGTAFSKSGGGGGGGNTVHGSRRAGERNFTQADIDEAKKTATETGNVTTQTGKYGTPQKLYSGTNGLTVVEETAGRNAGKIITGWWR
jgi:hypothetical protein